MTKPRTVESLEDEIRRKKGQIKILEDRKKVLTKKEADRVRKARTHRLCTYGGMLENFLKRPELFTDDEVMDLLTMAFRQPVVDSRLNELLRIKNRAEEGGPASQTVLSD